MNMSSKMHLKISFLIQKLNYMFPGFLLCLRIIFYFYSCGQLIHQVISWSNKFSCKTEIAIQLPFEKPQKLKTNKLIEVSVYLRVKDVSLNGKWWFGEKLFRYSFIRDFNLFLNISFSRTWASGQYSFSRRTSLLVFVVPKTVSPFWYDGKWVKWNVKNLALFFLPKGKITRWQQDDLHNTIIFIKYSIAVSFSQTIWKWDHEILGKLSPTIFQ